MSDEADPLRPSPAETQRILARSQATWSECAGQADQEELPVCCVQPQNLLRSVPSFPREHSDSSETLDQFRSYDNGRGDFSISIVGRSTWAISGKEYILDDKTTDHEVLWGISNPTEITFDEQDRFQNWPEVDNYAELPTGNNHLAILTSAWAYILSALWKEYAVSPQNFDEHGAANGLLYHGSESGSEVNPRTDDAVILVGPVSGQAARWWTALLANGQGWSVSCTRKRRRYLSPWSIRRADTRRFSIRPSVKQETEYYPQADNQPPLANSALQFLADYCDFHQIRSQAIAALAVALLLPFANLKKTVRLPNPRSQRQDTSHATTPASRPLPRPSIVILKQERLLPYYISLSCNTRGMRALLSGIFFEPMISVNTVSSCMQSAFRIIDPLLRASNFLQFVTVMSARNRTIAPLWLGVTILGLESSILEPLKNGLCAVELNASAWTGTIHSFLSLDHAADCSHDDSKIGREEEARLLYLIGGEEHKRPPVSPWPPIGLTSLSDANITVREHASCGGHRLTYKNWAWSHFGGEFRKDPGLSDIAPCERHWRPPCLPATLVHQNLDSEFLSELSTRSIFNWLRADGYPPQERHIRSHPWMCENTSDEEEDQISAPDSPSGHVEMSHNTLSWVTRDSV